MDINTILANELHIKLSQVQNTVNLIDDGNTIPFIARYRKEMTGSLDDQTLRVLGERLEYLRNLQKRRDEVCASIESLGLLTDDLAKAIENAVTLSEIEDVYRPYKPKRKTRASIAKEKGLEPLAAAIFEQQPQSDYPINLAAQYVNPEQGIGMAEDALAGACDIIAEWISDHAVIRKRLRVVCMSQGMITSKAAREEDSVYQIYYDFSEPVSRIASHRVLAIDRGEKEEFLKVSVTLDKDKALSIVFSETLKEPCPCTDTVISAATDAYNRLIYPSIEREIRAALTEKAADSAIKVFSVNLRQLLMQPPVKGKVALGLDPAYRTGCKIAVVDSTGLVLETGVIYPTPPHNKIDEARKTLTRLINQYKIEVVAIGNGTASRETEMFAAGLIGEIHHNLAYMVVSEAGASVYSASKLAAEEFPEFDVSLRSAVSIARRLQDPLAELVKIDPKAIGVGQYQHDMPKTKLDEALVGVVEDCVNTVGVDLNTASPSLLARIAGINAAVAKNIVKFREENGQFSSRSQLKKVPRLGGKAFEQCAGFLRVPESKNFLDNTSVHPESYPSAAKLLALCDFSPADVKKGAISDLKNRVDAFGAQNMANEIGIGEPTLHDVVNELLRPGRDPRDELPAPLLRTDVLDLSDLKPGMEVDGTVRNVIDFGAFIDIGVHQDGLVHISQITNRYIRHPSEVLKVGDIVKVWILSVDPAKKRIALTMKPPASAAGTKNPEKSAESTLS